MSYLDDRSILLDAVLTSAGKKLLKEGNLKVEYFALFDDEIDYQLHQPHALFGASDVNIIKVPLLEPNELYMPKYFLSNREPRNRRVGGVGTETLIYEDSVFLQDTNIGHPLAETGAVSGDSLDGGDAFNDVDSFDGGDAFNDVDSFDGGDAF